MDLKAIEEAFAARVLAQLHARELITDDDVAQILSQDHTGFGVWLGDPFHDKESEQFVARYIERSPLSLEKLSIQDDIVTYTTKDGTVHEFDTLEFLAQLSCHIPKTYESLTRYYGRYSCRRRGERAKLAPLEAEDTESDDRREFRGSHGSSWAACIKRVYEIDPLECPTCKAQMRIILLRAYALRRTSRLYPGCPFNQGHHRGLKGSRTFRRLHLSLSSSIPHTLSMNYPRTIRLRQRLMTSKIRFLCDGAGGVCVKCHFSRLMSLLPAPLGL